MILFVSFSALMNLAIGYALGAGLTFSDVLEMLPLRRRKSDADLDGDDALTRPPKTKKTAKTASVSESVAEKPEPTPEPTPPPTPAEEANAEETREVNPTVKPLDVMAGLADFREQLASAGLALKESQDDPEKFNDCAHKVQEANHGYIEHAIETATTLADQGDATSVAASQVIASGVEKAAAISEKFDEQLEGELTDENRAALINQASTMQDTATETQLSAEKQIAEAPADKSTEGDDSQEKGSQEKEPQEETTPESDKASDAGIVPVAPEKLFNQIEKALAMGKDEKTLVVASLSADPIEGQEDNGDLLAAIIRTLDELVSLSLEGPQFYSSAETDPAGRPTLLLGGDSFEEASQRMERLRQEVESTTFQQGEATYQATITCALTEVKKEDDQKIIETQLMQALDESEKSGHNKTYHHDGAFPTALPAIPVETEKRTVQI